MLNCSVVSNSVTPWTVSIALPCRFPAWECWWCPSCLSQVHSGQKNLLSLALCYLSSSTGSLGCFLDCILLLHLVENPRELSLWGLCLLEKEMATHSSTLAWRIPWTEEPGRLQSTGLQRVGHDWATSLHFMFIDTYCWRKLLRVPWTARRSN